MSEEIKGRRCRFVDDSITEKIDLGDGDWVKIPERFSYDALSEIAELDGKNNIETARNMLMLCIKEWNLINSDGEVAEINEKNVKSLEIGVVKKIVGEIEKKIEVDPKG